MATISPKSDVSIFQIAKWLGLNENADGDTKLKLGEAAEMRNFRITRDGNLQIRPGTKTLMEFDGPILGMWYGQVGTEGERFLVVAAGGHLWNVQAFSGEREDIGEITGDYAEFFGYSNKLYLLTGSEYYVWDGENPAKSVEGYRPRISTANPPAGGGQLLEGINKLTAAKRAVYSPDGTAKAFTLPEKDIASVDYAKNLATGDALPYTVNLATGVVTFSSAPASGTSSIEIGWTGKASDREAAVSMRFSEFYNGETDTRVFLYGNGTNAAFYSGLDSNGQPSAEYFPDLNVLHAGEANTPITGMIRHFSRLLIFKTNAAYAAYHSSLTTVTGAVIAAFYISPMNRAIGNAPPGQVRLIQNNPYTIWGREVYEWKSGGGYLTFDERSAKDISGRARMSLGKFDLAETHTFDDAVRQEYYMFYGGAALVHNYSEDVWYKYEQFPACCAALVDGELLIGTQAGQVRHVSRSYRNDDGEPIDAFWRSGSMDFSRDWMRKYASMIFISIKPESGARITVTARSNKKSEYAEKIVAAGLAGFARADFNHWGFRTNRQPQVERVKLKVKKFTYYQLIFSSLSASATATILAADFNIRYTGNVK